MSEMLYPNLSKAMKEKGVTKTDLATLLGVHFNTLTDKIEGITTSNSKTYNIGFTALEAFVISMTFFKEYDIEWLFDCEILHATVA